MQEPKIIESKVWFQASTGRTVSPYGSAPWRTSAEAEGWTLESRGWTLEFPDGTIGGGHPPAKTREEAEARVQRWRDVQAQYDAARDAAKAKS